MKGQTFRVKRGIGIFLLFFPVIAAIGVSRPPQRSIPLPSINKPSYIKVFANRLFVVERCKISIFSMKDFSIKKVIGREGEGPFEFSPVPFGSAVAIYLPGQELIVRSHDKFSWFTPDGAPVRENRISHFFQYPPTDIRVFPGGCVSTHVESADPGKNSQLFTVFTLFDSSMKKIKDLKRSPVSTDYGFMAFRPPFAAYTSRDRIILSSSADFYLEIFDAGGTRVCEIQREYERARVTGEAIREYKAKKKRFLGERLAPLVLPRLQFPGFFPAISRIYVDGETLYIITYKESPKGYETFVYDNSGRYMKVFYLPLLRQADIPSVFCISGGRLLQLFENEEKEQWELCMEDLP